LKRSNTKTKMHSSSTAINFYKDKCSHFFLRTNFFEKNYFVPNCWSCM